AQSPAPGSPVSGLGPHTITITATDDTGNSSTCTARLTLVDATIPVITTCAANQSVNANGSCAALVPNFTSGVVATDNCDSSVTITQSPAAGSTVSGLGPHTITITATDDTGNNSTCTATLTL